MTACDGGCKGVLVWSSDYAQASTNQAVDRSGGANAGMCCEVSHGAVLALSRLGVHMARVLGTNLTTTASAIKGGPYSVFNKWGLLRTGMTMLLCCAVALACILSRRRSYRRTLSLHSKDAALARPEGKQTAVRTVNAVHKPSSPPPAVQHSAARDFPRMARVRLLVLVGNVLANCPAGQYQESGACTDCEQGKYQPTAGTQTSCRNCLGGEYQDELGQSTCKLCPGISWPYFDSFGGPFFSSHSRNLVLPILRC